MDYNKRDTLKADGPIHCQGQFIIEWQQDTGEVAFEVTQSSTNDCKPSEDVCELLADFFHQNENIQYMLDENIKPQKIINYYTEYRRNNVIFRCHSGYRSQNQWRDWVMVRWEEENARSLQPDIDTIPAITYGDSADTQRFCYTPCKIVGYFYQGSTNTESYAVVWPCQYKFKKSSVFSTRWELSVSWQKKPLLQVVECDSIVRHCLMIPELLRDEAGSIYYHEIWPREMWGEEF